MRKPPDSYKIKFVGLEKLTPEEQQRYMQAVRDKIEQERRDYAIYEKGLRDGGRGIFGLLGL